jgi:hypothetical protein
LEMQVRISRRHHQIIAACLAIGMSSAADAADVYKWHSNVIVERPGADRVQAETALATDSEGQVWLSFLDARYWLTATKLWIAFPRRVRLFMSRDGGNTFSVRPDLDGSGGDEALAADHQGRVFATYVHYTGGGAKSTQQIALSRADSDQQPNTACLPWDGTTKHDQSSVRVGADETIHVIGVNIAKGDELLYARSIDGGKTCSAQHRLESIGELPQIVETATSVLIAGVGGYYLSSDRGVTFTTKVTRTFADKLARVAISPDRRTVYVVGDGATVGLLIHVSADGGRTWRVSRVAYSPQAHAWRYPAIHVDGRGRIHVVWMDDRSGFGALYHAYSDDGGVHFSADTKISDQSFIFPANAPEPPPATQDGTWIGGYLAVTSAADNVIVAWSDQREGNSKSIVRTAVGQAR